MEILLPETKDISPNLPKEMPFTVAWQNSTSLQKAAFAFLSAGTVASVAMFAVGQFFQTRGVQSVLTSRVFLFIAVIFPAAWLWQMAFLTKSKRWRWAAATLTLLLVVGACVLDRAFPMPRSVGVPEQKYSPLITMKLHPSSFPVSVPLRTTLHILPLHPFQTFTDAASQLHEYDNECSTDRPWPSEKEISSKPTNSYEEVRVVEITNHGPGTMEGGRIVIGVRYQKAFAGGCMVSPDSTQMKDVISLPTLDQGQTFSFVSVNQTDGCAWLMPPRTMRVKIAGNDNEIEVPLKLEAINVPNWISTPFGPTSVKWEGVPIKNPGYGVTRSGPVCEAPHGAKHPDTSRENKKQLREALGKFVDRGMTIRDHCADTGIDKAQLEAAGQAWADEVVAYLRANFDSSYVNQFRLTHTELNPNDIPADMLPFWHGMNERIQTLDRFIDESK